MNITINDINKDELLAAIAKVNALSDHGVILVTGLELFKNIEYFYGCKVIHTDYADDDKIFIIPKNHPGVKYRDVERLINYE